MKEEKYDRTTMMRYQYQEIIYIYNSSATMNPWHV